MDIANQLTALLQIVIIDLSLAADNAIVIGMAAAGLPKERRHKAVLAGLAGAVVLRIVLAFFAVRLLDIAGLTLAGGLLLLWVTWKMYRDIRRRSSHPLGTLVAGKIRKVSEKKTVNLPAKTLSAAILEILAADIGMSLDNILAVAGAANDHYIVLAIGLLLSVALVGAAATATAKLFHRWPWIGWIGIATVLYVAVAMMADGIGDIHQLMTGVRGF